MPGFSVSSQFRPSNSFSSTSNAEDLQGPSIAEIPKTLIVAVVGANHLDGDSHHRDIQIDEGNREMAHLHLSRDDHIHPIRGGLAV